MPAIAPLLRPEDELVSEAGIPVGEEVVLDEVVCCIVEDPNDDDEDELCSPNLLGMRIGMLLQHASESPQHQFSASKEPPQGVMA